MKNPKLKGQRLGQLIWNALAAEDLEMDDGDFANRLYFIDDKTLTSKINEFLERSGNAEL